jgi:uncharacterized protein YggT (Ycf19 family)
MIGVSNEKTAQDNLKETREVVRNYAKKMDAPIDSMFYSFDLIDFTGKTRYVIITYVNTEKEDVLHLPKKLYSWIFPSEMSVYNRFSNEMTSPCYAFFRTKNRRNAAYNYLIKPKSTK